MAVEIPDSIFDSIDDRRDDLVELARQLIRFPTVNPPGEAYRPCAEFIGRRLEPRGFQVTYVHAQGTPGDCDRHPRVNLIGRRRGALPGPCVHFNGHIDVVKTGGGWTLDPFAGVLRDGKLFGRGACDMKGGLAASILAVEALIDSGARLPGVLELSATVDEESGGYGGVHYLAERGWFSAPRVDHVIIPEPLNVDRVCIGHRGVWWAEIETRGRIAHGSMPFLGDCAVRHMNAVLDRFERDLFSTLAARTTAMPVVPSGARQATPQHQFDPRRSGGTMQRISGALRSGLVSNGDRPEVADRGKHRAGQARNADLLDRLAAERAGFSYGIRDIFKSSPPWPIRRAGRQRHRGGRAPCDRPRTAIRVLARHLRPKAHRPRRKTQRLHRLWSGLAGSGAQARRVCRRRRYGGIGQGDGAGGLVAPAQGRVDGHLSWAAPR